MSIEDQQQPVASTSASTSAQDEERQIPVRLTTKDASLSIPPTKFLIPASWKRFHLSELINKVLENEKPIPFDFLINESLLRSSLGAFVTAAGISEEVTLDIEYLPSTLPPQLEATLPTEDWVSDISVAIPGEILTASYGSTVSLHSSLFPPPNSSLSFVGHDQSVLSTCYVPLPSTSTSPSTTRWLASGGMDRVGRVWEFDTSSLSSLSTLPSAPLPAPTTLYTLSLHTAPISSVRSRKPNSTNTTSPHLITAGWDGIVGVWDLGKGVNEGEDEALEGGERKKKRRKQAPGVAIVKTPVSVLRGHNGKVSRAIFDHSDHNKAFSAGWDHTVRAWDLSVGAETESKTSDKVPLCLTQMATPNLLATGSTDRLISFWDLRETTQNISLLLPGHTAPVSSIASHPTSPLLLVSGSYDSTVRVWDARSPKQSLFAMTLPPKEEGAKAGEKILAVDWDGERAVAGGEGNRVVVWKVSAGTEGPVRMEE